MQAVASICTVIFRLCLIQNITYSFKDALVRVRLGNLNLKVHKNRSVRHENDSPFCPGFQENELHLFFVCKTYDSLRPDMVKNIEPHLERAQFLRLMSCQVESVVRKTAWFIFKCSETRDRLLDGRLANPYRVKNIKKNAARMNVCVRLR